MLLLILSYIHDVVVYRYRVEVQTGKMPNAGTEANVHMTIVGLRGDSGERSLLSSKKRQFVPGRVSSSCYKSYDAGNDVETRIIDAMAPGLRMALTVTYGALQ